MTNSCQGLSKRIGAPKSLEAHNKKLKEDGMLLGLNILKPQKEKIEFDAIGPYGCAGEEPKLSELLDDPLVHLVAKSDRITPQQLAGCVEKARRKLALRH